MSSETGQGLPSRMWVEYVNFHRRQKRFRRRFRRTHPFAAAFFMAVFTGVTGIYFGILWVVLGLPAFQL